LVYLGLYLLVGFLITVLLLKKTEFFDGGSEGVRILTIVAYPVMLVMAACVLLEKWLTKIGEKSHGKEHSNYESD
jgi:Mn2+/Fe2+ NRAMP family transporter